MKSSARLFCSLFLGMAIVSCCNAINAQLLVNDWDTDLEDWRFDFGPAGATLAQDPTEGSPGNAAGALRLDMNFNIAINGGSNRFAYTGDVFGSETDLSIYDEVLIDVKIDQTSVQDAFGNHGFFSFVSRETDGYSFNTVASQNLPSATPEWITLSAPASSLTATRAFTVQLYGGPSQNITGDITLWIDNLRLTSAPVPEPTTGLLGLIAVTLSAFSSRNRS